jgi:hypothetical protein
LLAERRDRTTSETYKECADHEHRVCQEQDVRDPIEYFTKGEDPLVKKDDGKFDQSIREMADDHVGK